MEAASLAGAEDLEDDEVIEFSAGSAGDADAPANEAADVGDDRSIAVGDGIAACTPETDADADEPGGVGGGEGHIGRSARAYGLGVAVASPLGADDLRPHAIGRNRVDQGVSRATRRVAAG